MIGVVPRRVPDVSAPPPLSEASWQRRVTDFATYLQLRWHHETDSRRTRAGFPDLVIVGPGGHGFFELKTDSGRVSIEQQSWIDDLTAGGALAEVWRPTDWTHVQNVLRRLARPVPDGGDDE